jgi:hypothetical protein
LIVSAKPRVRCLIGAGETAAKLAASGDLTMIKNKRALRKAQQEAWEAADVADARVGIWPDGEPVVTVRVPTKRPITGFAAIADALCDRGIVVRLCSGDRRESVDFFLDGMSVVGHEKKRRQR